MCKGTVMTTGELRLTTLNGIEAVYLQVFNRVNIFYKGKLIHQMENIQTLTVSELCNLLDSFKL